MPESQEQGGEDLLLRRTDLARRRVHAVGRSVRWRLVAALYRARRSFRVKLAPVRQKIRKRIAPIGVPLLAVAAVATLVLSTIPKDSNRLEAAQAAGQGVQLASLLDWGKLGAGITVARGLSPLVATAKSPDVLETTPYIVQSGNTISEIGRQFGVSDESIISINHVDDARLLQPGVVLLIPNMDGVLYRTESGDTLEKIAEHYHVPEAAIVTANRMSGASIRPHQELFIPGGHMSSYAYRRALGTLFLFPAQGYITSYYGMRRDPFTRVYSFHNGIDIGNSIGTPVDASADGQIVAIGSNRIYGNYILIDHGGGYQSLYAHLWRIYVRLWQWVRSGQQIAAMGDSGYSTGPHLHFSIFKDDVPVNPMIYLHY